MPTKPRQQSEPDPYARVTRSFLLKELPCTKTFDKFQEGAQNGSIIGIAGDDFAIIAVDARHWNETNQALHRITGKLVMATTGHQCCAAQLASMLRARMFMNEYMRKREIPSECVAMLLSCLKTNQRHHSNHVSTLMAGLDHQCKGVIYAYNPLGYHDVVKYRAMGAAANILQPILRKNLAPQPARRLLCSTNTDGVQSADFELSLSGAPATLPPKKITFDEAFELIVCAFKEAAKCANVYTGNVLVLDAITKEGCFTHEIILNNQQRKSVEAWM